MVAEVQQQIKGRRFAMVDEAKEDGSVEMDLGFSSEFIILVVKSSCVVNDAAQSGECQFRDTQYDVHRQQSQKGMSKEVILNGGKQGFTVVLCTSIEVLSGSGR